MFGLFIRLKTLLEAPYVHIDGLVFRLHWCYTSSILLVCSLFILSKQYLDNPIICLNTGIDSSTLNDYCWLHSTYTISHKLVENNDVAHPGVDMARDRERIRNVSHYQWVGFFLLFQACLFYLPRVFWKNLEAGKISCLLGNIDGLRTKTEKKEKQKKILDYLYDNLRTHDSWAYWYFFCCELIALLNVLLQILLTNKFLYFSFLNFGSGVEVDAWWRQEDEDQSDHLMFSLPHEIRCIFHKFGSSGNIEKLVSLCTLPVNVFNEKIFFFLWIWFFFLLLLSSCVLIYRIVISLSQQARTLLLPRIVRDTMASNTGVGDYLVLDLLAKNVEHNTFKEIIADLADKLGRADKSHE